MRRNCDRVEAQSASSHPALLAQLAPASRCCMYRYLAGLNFKGLVIYLTMVDIGKTPSFSQAVIIHCLNAL